MDIDVRDLLQDFTDTVAPQKNIKLKYLAKDGEFSFAEYVKFINVLDQHTRAQLEIPEILKILKTGNARFASGRWSKKDFRDQVNATSAGQFPMATVLSCIDSRSAPETIFDTNIGDLICVRIAGNIVNEDIIGSLELAHSKIGTKLIVILGHSNCGAIGVAIQDLQDGHIGHITKKIKPSIDAAFSLKLSKHSEVDFTEDVCRRNIENSMREVLNSSSYISEQISAGKLAIICAYYDTTTGLVHFEGLNHASTSDTLDTRLMKENLVLHPMTNIPN